jgi:hypothetical protein
MLICFQKRFGGVVRLTAIWVDISIFRLPTRIRLEKFDLKTNPYKWMDGIKPQRGEIFVERRVLSIPGAGAEIV